MKKFYLLVASIFWMLPAVVLCGPAYPDPIEFTQPDGSSITLKLKGDEHLHWAETIDGYTLLFNSHGFYEYATVNEYGDLVCSGRIARNESVRSKADSYFLMGISKQLQFTKKQVKMLKSIREMKEDKPEKAFPASGSRKLVCILMAFKDVPFTKTKADFENLFNQLNYTVDGAVGSVRDFYKENSYNQLDLTVTVAGPYTANNDMAFYGANDQDGNDVNRRALITDAVQKADPDVNYSNFDNDNNGSVDGVYVIFAGYSEDAGAQDNTIWSHKWSIPSITLDGKIVNTYACSPELRGNSGTGITRVGVICHEFGHVLGAPDFYDTNYEEDGSFSGTGRWDLMANGSWNNSGITPAHHNAYTKTQIYNWASAVVLSSPEKITLINSVKSSNCFYRINTTTPNEFFICENRQKVGFDAYIPGHGLIIYHKHADGTSNATYPQMFYPVCAGATTEPGNTSTSYGSINSQSCPFPGSTNKTSFTDVTTPSSKSWALNFTDKPITEISESTTDSTISFKFMGFGSGYPENFAATATSTTQIGLSWNKNSDNDNVMIAFSTTNAIGSPVNGTTYAIGEVLPGGGTIIYSGSETIFNHSSLNASSTYFYKAWSVKIGTIYSTGISKACNTLCGIGSLPFIENFDGGIVPSACWTSFRGTNGLGTLKDWTSNPNGYGGSGGAAFVQFENVDGTLKTEDWLVTPKITIPFGSNFSLNYYEKQGSSLDYSSRYYVKVSTSLTPEITSFQNIATYGEASFGTGYTKRSIDLSSYAGQNVYIAFVLEQDNGDSWYIDNVVVSNTMATGPDGTWIGNTSDDWATASNWSNGTIPSSSVSVVIPAGCKNYPVVNETASCNNITIQNNAALTIAGGANFSTNNIYVGSGISGSFTMTGGTCNVSNYFYSELGSRITISGGTINLDYWTRNTSTSYAVGNITLSGGTINATNVYYSAGNIVGIMNGPFIMNIKGNYISNSNNWSVTGGTVNLLGTANYTNLYISSSNLSLGCVAYNLNVNAPNKTYYFCSLLTGKNTIYVKNNLTVTAGSLQLIKSATVKVGVLDVDGNFIINTGASLTCDSTTINVGGSWINNGTFNPAKSLVAFDGGNQSISGLNTFFNLTKKTIVPVTLTFGSGPSNKTTVEGTLKLQGANNKLLSLRSSMDGSAWEISAKNKDVNYLDIKDSYNTDTAFIKSCSSVNSGNNVKWKFDCTVGVNDPVQPMSVKVYPNPVVNELIIELKDQIITAVSLYSIDQKCVLQQNNEGQKVKIDVSGLPAGFYILKIEGGGRSAIYKIIKK